MRPVSVFVGGLGDDVSKEDLEREFGKYGTLSKVWVAQNPPGFAFLEYESLEEANEAIDAMNGTTINNSRIRVEQSRNSNRGRRGGGGDRSGGGRDGFRERDGGYRGGRDGGFRGRGGSGYSRRDDSYGDRGSYRGSNRDRYGSSQNESRDQFSSSYSGSSYGGMGDGGYKSSYRSRSPVGSRSSNW